MVRKKCLEKFSLLALIAALIVAIAIYFTSIANAESNQAKNEGQAIDVTFTMTDFENAYLELDEVSKTEEAKVLSTDGSPILQGDAVDIDTSSQSQVTVNFASGKHVCIFYANPKPEQNFTATDGRITSLKFYDNIGNDITNLITTYKKVPVNVTALTVKAFFTPNIFTVDGITYQVGKYFSWEYFKDMYSAAVISVDQTALDENGTLTIPNRVTPEGLEDYYYVSAIGSEAHKSIQGVDTSIKSVHFPGSLQLIFPDCMSDCKDLKRIEFDWSILGPELVDFKTYATMTRFFPSAFYTMYTGDTNMSTVNDQPSLVDGYVRITNFGPFVWDDKTRVTNGGFVEAGTISGKVVDENGLAIEGAEVVFDDMITSELSLEHGKVSKAVTAADGTFVLRDVLVNNYNYWNPKKTPQPLGTEQYIEVSAQGHVGQKIYTDAFVTNTLGEHNYPLKNNIVLQSMSGQSAFIASAANPNYVIDCVGGGSADGTNIQLYSYNATDAQIWKVEVIDVDTDGNAIVTIINKANNRVLDLSGGKATNGGNVWLYKSNGSDAQKWTMVKVADSQYKFLSKVNSNYALDVTSGYIANCSNIQVWEDNGTAAQKFIVLDQHPNVKPEYRDMEDGYYTVSPAYNQNVTLDVQWGSKVSGSNVWIYDKASKIDKNQVFYINNLGNGYYNIYCANSGLALDCAGANIIPGTNVWQYTPNETDAQKWVIRYNANETYTFINVATGLALDVCGGNLQSQTNVQGYYPNGTNAQQWAVLPVDINQVEQQESNGINFTVNIEPDYGSFTIYHLYYEEGEFGEFIPIEEILQNQNTWTDENLSTIDMTLNTGFRIMDNTLTYEYYDANLQYNYVEITALPKQTTAPLQGWYIDSVDIEEPLPEFISPMDYPFGYSALWEEGGTYNFTCEYYSPTYCSYSFDIVGGGDAWVENAEGEKVTEDTISLDDQGHAYASYDSIDKKINVTNFWGDSKDYYVKFNEETSILGDVEVVETMGASNYTFTINATKKLATINFAADHGTVTTIYGEPVSSINAPVGYSWCVVKDPLEIFSDTLYICKDPEYLTDIWAAYSAVPESEDYLFEGWTPASGKVAEGSQTITANFKKLESHKVKLGSMPTDYGRLYTLDEKGKPTVLAPESIDVKDGYYLVPDKHVYNGIERNIIMVSKYPDKDDGSGTMYNAAEKIIVAIPNPTYYFYQWNIKQATKVVKDMTLMAIFQTDRWIED